MQKIQEYLMQFGIKDVQSVNKTTELYNNILKSALKASNDIFDGHEVAPLALIVAAEVLLESVRARPRSKILK